MVHCKGYIITKELPAEDRIAKILDKYYDDRSGFQQFCWDWYEIGGRYGGKIKIKFDPKNNEDDWYLFHNRNHKYFISNLLDEIKSNDKSYEELHYLKYMGLNEKTLYVDGAYYKDIINFEIDNCFLVIDDEENLYLRKSRNGEDYIEDLEFDNKVNKIDLTDKFITVVDFHY